ncbi:hypothetical protein RG47T_0639 [Mucilaginibacter polytrichastri]|uniref:Uncharacterized protein n=1 Tax=Mucilaginibacter polytrichastri TaxID=1302689 RepID=A0A1Q5ZTU6_9SPHI|nr:hypothetical protein RG47T_0639 [Mucilaginibacter polytrichastri]
MLTQSHASLSFRLTYAKAIKAKQKITFKIISSITGDYAA